SETQPCARPNCGGTSIAPAPLTKEDSHSGRQHHNPAERSVSGRGRVRAGRSDRSSDQHGGPDENRALPLRPVQQQADVRRHAQQGWLSGLGGRKEVAYSGRASGSTSVSSTQSSGGSGSGRVRGAEVS